MHSHATNVVQRSSVEIVEMIVIYGLDRDFAIVTCIQHHKSDDIVQCPAICVHTDQCINRTNDFNKFIVLD